ncbi:RNA polymerase B [Thoreauomyces humboldtii]|nr:RNA polymerase B [Thoreauomyces humboldtii]
MDDDELDTGDYSHGATTEPIPSIYQPPRELIPPRGAREADNTDASELGPGALSELNTGKKGKAVATAPASLNFNRAQCLLIPEVKVILDKEKREHGNSGIERPQNEVLEKTLAYCTRFSAYTNPHTVRHIKNTIDATRYSPFEIAQMGNLTIETPEEAKALIQSLDRKSLDDNELLGTLMDLANLRKYQAAT